MNSFQQRFEKLTSSQQQRVRTLLLRIIGCEGKIPPKYWCRSCNQTAQKLYDLMKKFELKNKKKRDQELKRRSTSPYFDWYGNGNCTKTNPPTFFN